MNPMPPQTRREARRRARPRAGIASRIGFVLGELLMTAGVLVLLFLGWQLWLNDLIVGAEQRDAAQQFSDSLTAATPVPSPSVTPDPSEEPGEPADPADHGDPVSTVVPVINTGFATLHIPRFGADYVRTIAEGVSLPDILNRADLGVGHYPETQLPGEVGNFALTAHRTTYGAPFKDIASLQLGDRFYVQTVDGWYTYQFRNLEYVWPNEVEVLEPVPQAPGVATNERIITLTSCNPRFSAAERIIAYGVLESWQPASEGMPADLAQIKEANA